MGFRVEERKRRPHEGKAEPEWGAEPKKSRRKEKGVTKSHPKKVKKAKPIQRPRTGKHL